MSEAKAAGLVFKDMPDAEPDALISTDSAKDKDGRLYDSRSGLGGYYRYSPRKIQDFYDAMPVTLAPDGTPHAIGIPSTEGWWPVGQSTLNPRRTMSRAQLRLVS